MECYHKFVVNVILPYLGLSEALVQTLPSYRVQLPNMKAIYVPHYDSDENHYHPIGEINFVIPLTSMRDTSTIWAETQPRLKDYHPINMDVGDALCANFNLCTHFNKINDTGLTRVSLDFRVMPLNKYNPDYQHSTATTGIKFLEGEYYTRFNNNTLVRDPWDKMKGQFMNVLLKYNLKDPWDIVDLFERKIATYAGSKYAVSVDNCTNALFLCLKYLNATGEITIPSHTYVSVPCTIINAGCQIKFKNVEWSGCYQLEPYPIYDGAVRFKKGMYVQDSYYCLSFHIRKHVPIGKGGMILCNDIDAYNWFKMARYEGRHTNLTYKDDYFDIIGWNMYMTPEQAHRGIELFEKLDDDNPDQASSGMCKDLSIYPIYENANRTRDDKLYYSYDYWFRNREHNNWDQGGEKYYVNYFYEDAIFKLDIPKDGYIVVLGTHNCVSFDKLCKHFGYERCIGYDLYNPTNHPNVIIKDCLTLNDTDNIPIALCHNDLGNFATTPVLKMHGQKWAIKNIISGGYFLGNNNNNCKKINIEQLMCNNGFKNIQLNELHNGTPSRVPIERLRGYMISKKRQ